MKFEVIVTDAAGLLLVSCDTQDSVWLAADGSVLRFGVTTTAPIESLRFTYVSALALRQIVEVGSVLGSERNGVVSFEIWPAVDGATHIADLWWELDVAPGSYAVELIDAQARLSDGTLIPLAGATVIVEVP